MINCEVKNKTRVKVQKLQNERRIQALAPSLFQKSAKFIKPKVKIKQESEGAEAGAPKKYIGMTLSPPRRAGDVRRMGRVE